MVFTYIRSCQFSVSLQSSNQMLTVRKWQYEDFDSPVAMPILIIIYQDGIIHKETI